VSILCVCFGSSAVVFLVLPPGHRWRATACRPGSTRRCRLPTSQYPVATAPRHR